MVGQAVGPDLPGSLFDLRSGTASMTLYSSMLGPKSRSRSMGTDEDICGLANPRLTFVWACRL